LQLNSLREGVYRTLQRSIFEAVCRVLGNTEQGLTGKQIEHLFQEIGVADISPSLTKWKRLFNALAEA
jgi:hypothetical protein